MGNGTHEARDAREEVATDIAGTNKIVGKGLETEEIGLSEDEVAHFIEHGFVMLRNAFSPHGLKGRAGDVMLTHPFLMHARSKNCGASVRFMCNPNVGLKEPMQLFQTTGADEDADTRVLSAVEAAIVQALGEPSTLNRNKKRKRS
ncbi:hypothetical protein DYB32_006384 [Aphanomyces invadans]|uniref:Uncharacterized protein n=1 Tax=Aphanomyces invadans TaxID=157072 RepID=A0A3R6VJM5_9STRA|nr:hypothetical protein DYB32_006384 [Aphanomyces invadans]